jgi:putative ABC transport system permease protein
MIRLAWKNLTEERLRLAISAGGVALALVLILVMQGVFAGSEEHAVSYMRNQPADLWVMQDGVENLHMATSVLPSTVLSRIRRTAGVAQAVGVLYANVGVEVGEATVFSYVFGVDPKAPFGGPWSLVAGSPPIRLDEIVIDKDLAARHGIGLGDEISILDHDLTVSGLAEGNFGIATSLVFVTKRTLADMVGVPASLDSYVLVRQEGQADPAALSEDLASIKDVTVLTTDEFIASDKILIQQMGVDVIRAMNSVAYVVGMLVIGLNLYTATLERKREYGILRAIGGSRSQLWTVVLVQAGISALLGIGMGIGLAYALAQFINQALPEMLVLLRFENILAVVGTLLAVTAVAAILPAVQVGRADPMVVFRA